MAFGQPVACRDASPDQLSRAVGHAWTTYQHARYPQLIERLPTLLTDVQQLQARDPNADRTAVVEAYRVTAALLVKLDEVSLAWLAADRAMSAATGDRVLLACAAVQLGQVLRASARAKTMLLAAAYRIAPAVPRIWSTPRVRTSRSRCNRGGSDSDAGRRHRAIGDTAPTGGAQRRRRGCPTSERAYGDH
jgi:hypothetical protein